MIPCLNAMAAVMVFSHCAIKSVKEAESALEEKFQKTFRSAKHSKSAALLVHSDRLKLHLATAAGTVDGPAQRQAAVPGQPFHAASIGKLCTAVLVMQYVEAGKLALSDPVTRFLGPEILRNLFTSAGTDHAGEVTIGELLSHTSGMDDYFDSRLPGTQSVLAEILRQPDRFWTPGELLDFTRRNQHAVGLPGKHFYYSDGGYILLGLILEKVSGKTFERLIHERLFDPLGMNHSYMHLRSSPRIKSGLRLSTMMLGDRDVTGYRSISADWTGGGVITTTSDLLLFHRALVTGRLLNPKTYDTMKGAHKFMDGIHYGLGMMTLRFGDMSALMPKTPELFGHSGLLSTVMFYCPEYDTHIIANLGSTEDIAATFEMVFWFMRTLRELQALSTQAR